MNPDAIQKTIAQFLEGDRDAFQTIHDLYKDSLWRFLYTRADNREDAEDLFNIVSLTVAEKLDSLQEPAKLVSWVIGIAIKRLSEFYRRKQPGRQVDDWRLAAEESAEPSAEKSLIQNQTIRQLKACMADLKEPNRTYVQLFFLGEVSQQQISTEFEVKLNTLKSIILRAKIALLTCLQKHGFFTDSGVETAGKKGIEGWA